MSVIVFRDDSEERVKELAREMGWRDIRIADGCVKRLWQSSQALKATTANSAKIVQWCLESEHPERLVSALHAARFIKQIGDDLFEILGNKTEIEKISKARKQRADAAKKRWQGKHKKESRKPRADKGTQECGPHKEKHAVRTPLILGLDPGLDSGSGLDSGTGSKSDGGHSANAAPPPVVALVPVADPPASTRAKRPRADPEPSTPAGHVWLAYREAYAARYKHDPVRNSKVNAQCAQLVARLGAEAAERVVRFYLNHQGRFYVQCVHALGPCLKDAEALHTQMLAGHRMSSSEAQAKDRQQGNMQAAANVFAKLKAEGVFRDEP